MEINEVLPKVKANLTKERYEHTLRVIETAKELAVIHDVDVKKVELASALHDYAKCEDESYLKQYIIDNNLDLDLLNYNQELWHSHVGGHFAQYKLNINDESTLNAIKYHTTGRADMDNIELVVFIADFIEPARKIPGIEEIRDKAKENLHEAALLIFKASIPYLISLGAIVYPGTLEAYNYLIKYKGDH